MSHVLLFVPRRGPLGSAPSSWARRFRRGRLQALPSSASTSAFFRAIVHLRRQCMIRNIRLCYDTLLSFLVLRMYLYFFFPGLFLCLCLFFWFVLLFFALYFEVVLFFAVFQVPGSSSTLLWPRVRAIGLMWENKGKNNCIYNGVISYILHHTRCYSYISAGYAR